MAKILLTLTGHPSNIGGSQKFDDQKHFDGWLASVGGENGLLPNAKSDGKKVTFDGGHGVIETVLDSFDNSKPESAENKKK